MLHCTCVGVVRDRDLWNTGRDLASFGLNVGGPDHLAPLFSSSTMSLPKSTGVINAGLADGGSRRLSDLGGIPMSMTPVDFGKLIVDETEKWGK